MENDNEPLSSLVRAHSNRLEDRLLRIEGNLPAVLYEFERDESLPFGGRFLYLTPQWEAQTGVPRDEALADYSVALGLIHRDDIQRYLEADDTALNHGISLRIKVRIWPRQGKMRWIEIVESPYMRTSEGRMVLNGLAMDITAEKEAQDRLVAMVQSLSERERQVFAGLGVGKTLKEIAKALGVSPSTIKAHKAKVMRKLGAKKLSEVVLVYGVTAE